MQVVNPCFFMTLRKPTNTELALIEYLMGIAALKNLSAEWKNTLLVSPMDDGGMGSLLLFPNEHITDGRRFGKCVSEYLFRDADEIDVLASLNLDQEGQLFELDMWKVDFNPLMRWPEAYP